MAQWDRDLHARIAQAIRRARGKRSAQWLADRTVELGYPITRAQIANYESGRKKTLDVAELVILAAALNTSPAVLVYAGPYDAEVELFPGERWSQFTAVQWFSAIPEEPYGEGAAWRAATSGLSTWRRLDDLESSRDVLEIRVNNTGPDEPPPTLLYMQIEMYNKEIEELKERIRLSAVEQVWGLDGSDGRDGDSDNA